MNCSADIRWNRIPTPSIRAKSTPPTIADPIMAPVPSGHGQLAHETNICNESKRLEERREREGERELRNEKNAVCKHSLLTARMAPVDAPEMILFQGSSFFLKCTMVQSMVENKPPHTAKLPPMIGALCRIAAALPRSRRLNPCIRMRLNEVEPGLESMMKSQKHTHRWCIPESFDTHEN